ncbi:MAG: phosphatase PAP2 family protein [Planctomycetes bacterium]|nr:phosphatase PAP2 family protein [Planctomycetota bacterium]
MHQINCGAPETIRLGCRPFLPYTWDGERHVPAGETFELWPDLKSLPGMLWADTKSMFTLQNAFVLGAAAGAAVWIRDDLDQQVRNETAEHPLRWGQGSVVLRQFGEYTVQVPALVGVYAVGLWTQDPTLHEFSLTTISAYTISAVTTVTIKAITNTQRPSTEFQNGQYGFPSFHTSSTFAIAACIDEFYGWQVGVPAYVMAGLVGWSRIDQREHDLSDVLFGAVLGIVVGKTVSAAHFDRIADMKITPYYDWQNQATGVAFEKRF